MSSGQPYDADVWKQLSALGLTGLIIPAEHGGAEAGYSVLSVALTELGAGSCPRRCSPARWRRAPCCGSMTSRPGPGCCRASPAAG